MYPSGSYNHRHASLLFCLMWFVCIAQFIGCRPSFDGDDACLSVADCFSDEICSEGVCVAGEPTPDIKPVRILRFGASVAEAELDEEVTLSWEMDDVVSATIASEDDSFMYTIPDADLEEGSTTLTISATVTLTLTAFGEEEGDEASSTTKVNLREVEEPMPEPVIDSFTASSGLIMPGESTTLNWSFTDVDRAELSDGMMTTTLTGSDLQSGELEVTPEQSTNYTIRAFNEDRETMRTVQVIVQGQAPVITSFESSATRIEQQGDVTLSWVVAGATTLTMEDESGAMIDLMGTSVAMDSITQTIPGNKTYTLTASNDWGMASETVAIVAYERLEVTSFEAAPEFVAPGDQTILSWAIAGNPASLVITSDADGMPVDLMGASPAAGSLPVVVNQDTTYTLTAQNNEGDMITAMVTVQLLPPLPQIQLFDPSDTFVTAGSTVTLNWQVTGATALMLEDDTGAMIDLTGKMLDIDSIDVVINTDRTYTLTASNVAGDATSAVLIAVGDPVTAMLSSNVLMVNAGDDVTLSWTTGFATSISLTSSLGETIDLTGKDIANDSVVVAPAEDVTYTLTAQGFAGPATATVMLTVNPVVSITTFTSSAFLIDQGDPVTLSWEIENSTSFTLEATDSSGTMLIDTSMLFTMDMLTLSPAETTTYVINALGDTGDTDRRELTVVVDVPPTIDSFIASPETLDLTNGPTVSTLSWTTSHTTQWSLLDLNTGLPVMFTDLGNGAGTVDVSPTVTTTYLLNAGNAQGTFANQMLTVTVIP